MGSSHDGNAAHWQKVFMHTKHGYLVHHFTHALALYDSDQLTQKLCYGTKKYIFLYQLDTVLP